MKSSAHSCALAFCFFLIGCGGSSGDGEPENPVMDDEPPPQIDADPELIGPLGGTGADGEYSQFNDSPFANLDFSGGYFYLEDFEDQVLEHPGASASAGNFVSIAFGPSLHDSVDADDGLIDGNSVDGESWFVRIAPTGVTWEFDAAELGGLLPTHAGLVWTDGAGEITFEAFDSNGDSLGTVTGNHDDPVFTGRTNDDRFYGVVNLNGISAIKISEATRSMEMDHLQWGRQR